MSKPILTIEEAAKQKLILYRDHLFDKYLEVYDKCERWSKGEVPLAIGRTTGAKETRKQMVFMMKNHLLEISEQLREIDTLICRVKTPEDIYIENKEIY